MKRSIMIIDDHPVLREGITAMIDNEPDLEVIAQFDGAAGALAELKERRPEMLLIDLTLNGENGLDLMRAVAEKWPWLPMLVLSAHDENQYAERAMKAGARGYVMKTEKRETILEAIRCVLKGEIHLSAAATPRVLAQLLARGPKGEPPVEESLTDREIEVFRMFGSGLATDAIAEVLRISPKTIRVHRHNIMHKLRLAGSIQLYQKSYEWLREQGLREQAQ